MFNLKALTLATVTFVCISQAVAQVEKVSIASIGGSRQLVYEIIPPGDASVEPGVYKLDRASAKAELIVKGSVMGLSRVFNGLLYQFELTKKTFRDEALAVVDGQLTLFSKVSSLKKADSVLTIGTSEAPVVDPITGHAVRLSPIHNLQDVHVYGASSLEGEALLVSIRQGSPFGDGLTFALMLKGKAGERVEISSQIYLINYHFMQPQQLAQLTGSRATYIYSHNILSSFARSKSNDSQGKTQWRAEIQKFLATLPPQSKPVRDKNRDLSHVPLFNLSNGLVELQTFPLAVLTPPHHPVGVAQVEDPLGGRDAAYFVSAEEMSQPNLMRAIANRSRGGAHVGLIDTVAGPKPKPFVFTSPGPDDLFVPPNNIFGHHPIDASDLTVQSTLIRIDGRYQVAFNDTGYSRSPVHTIDLTPYMSALDGRTVRDLNYLHFVQKVENQKIERHFFLISVRCDEGPITFGIRIDEENRIVRAYRITLVDRVFRTQKQLGVRTLAYREGIYFDPHTRDAKLTALRSQQMLASTPFKEMITGMDTHLSAIETRQLASTGYRWFRFQDVTTGNSATQTGIYLTSAGQPDVPRSNLTLVAPGYLKTRPSDIDPEHPEVIKPIESIQLKIDTRKSDLYDEPDYRMARLHLFAVGTETGRSDSTSFLLDLQQPHGATQSDQHLIVQVPASFEQLIDAKIVRGRNKVRDHFSLILNLQTKANDKKKGTGGIFVFNFRLLEPTPQSHSQYTLLEGPRGWIAKASIDPNLLTSHVTFDKRGQPLWIDDPTLDKNDPTYTVVQMFLAEKGRSILRDLPDSVMFGEVLGADETKGWTRSEWLISYTDQIGKMIPSLHGVFESRESKKKKSDKEDVLQYFPGLPDYLTAYATKDESPRHEIVLVQKDLKKAFLMAMFERYVHGDPGFSRGNLGFSLFVYGSDLTDRGISRELGGVAQTTRKKLLFVDGSHLVHLKPDEHHGEHVEESSERDPRDLPPEALGQSHDSDPEKITDPGSRGPVPLVRLLAAEGNRSLTQDPNQIKRMRTAIPMMILMTPAEYRHLIDENPEDANTYFAENFRVRSDFLSANWGLWSPKSSRASVAVKEAVKEGVSDDAIRVFPVLNQLLTAAATPNAPAKHQIVVFPDELKPLMNKLILGRWASSSRTLADPTSPLSIWNHRNADLSILKIPGVSEGRLTQESVFENYSAIEQIRRARRPVVIGQLSDVLAIGRVDAADGEKPFQITDPSAHGAQTDLRLADESGSPEIVAKSSNLPHLLWLLATEGKKIQPSLKPGWKLSDTVDPQVPTILYGTRSDLEKLMSDVTFEQRMVDLRTEFDIIQLGEPPVDVRRSLLSQVLSERGQIRTLELQYQVNPQHEPKRDPSEIISVLVARVEQVARSPEVKQDPTSAFIRVYSELQSFIIQDPTIRRSRLFDKAAVERLLSRVFPIGLKLENLPPDDILHQVSDPVRAVIRWQEQGFRGYSKLKREVAEQVFSQTAAVHDKGRPMPNSAIFFGPTSTGKTYLVETFFKMLGLEGFDPRNPAKPAGYFKFKGQDIYEDEKIDADKLTASKAIALMENFLCLNDRGIIFADDFHKVASTGAMKALTTFFSGMFDAPNGMFRVRCADGTTREIPIRNSGLWITMNPASDKTMRERFAGKNQLDNEILAAWSKPDYIIEGSLLSRFAGKYDMANFPAGAKVASIISGVREASQGQYNSRQALILTSPHAVNQLASRFDDANAREILSPAITALLEFPRDIGHAPIYLIDLKNSAKEKILRAAPDVTWHTPALKGGSVTRETVRGALREFVAYRTVDGESVPSMLDFLSFLLDGFRIHAYQALLEGFQAEPQFNHSEDTRDLFVAQMLMSIFDTISEWSTVPLNNVPIFPGDLGWATQGKMMEYSDALGERSESPDSPRAFFKYDFVPTPPGTQTSLSTTDLQDRRILTVLSETSWRIQQTMRKLMAAYFRVVDLQHLPGSREWVETVHAQVEPAVIADLGTELAQTYATFAKQLFDPDLLEFKNASEFGKPLVKISPYDQARLFLQAFDKAIVTLPWARMTHFSYQGLRTATEDHSLGYLPEFQGYMFASRFTPFDTITPDTIFQSITGHPDFKERTDEERERRRRRFTNMCQSMLFTDEYLTSFKGGGN